MKKTATLFTSIALLVLSFTSCEKKADAPEQLANVLVAHGVPDATNVDVTIDAKKVNTAAIGFGGTTGYVKVTAGDRMVRLNTAGTTTSLSNSSFSFAANKNYSVFASNRMNSIAKFVVEDNLTTPAAGKAHIRVVHLSPDAATVNVFSGTSTVPLFSNVSFKNATAFVPVDATATGTAVSLVLKVSSTGATVLTSPVTVSAGKIYTVVLRGFAAPPTGNTNTLSTSAMMNN